MEFSVLFAGVQNYCSELIGGEWREFKDQIVIEKIKMGMGNRTFLCLLPLKKTQSTVVVKIYGNESLSGESDQQTKTLCEAAEAVVFDRLALQGMAPNLIALFEGGRIEEYVKGRNVTFNDLKDVSIYKAVARKLAHFHTQKMPISKSSLFIPLIKNHYKRTKITKDFSHLSDNQRKLIRKLDDFPLEDELEFSIALAKKVNSKLVFSHNDLFVMNIMIKDEGNTLFDRLLIIDYELNDYNHRGYDLAMFLYGHEFEVIADECDNYYTYLGNTATEELKQTFAEEYLNELNAIGEQNDLQCDNIEHLVMEIEVLAIQLYLVLLVFIRLTIYDTNFGFGSLEYINDMIRLYSSLKEKISKKYPLLFN